MACSKKPTASAARSNMQPGSGSRSTVTRTPVRSSMRASARTSCWRNAHASPTLAPQPSTLKLGRQPSGSVEIDAWAVPGGTSSASSSASSSVCIARRASAQCGS
jgi:hypothetical protein